MQLAKREAEELAANNPSTPLVNTACLNNPASPDNGHLPPGGYSGHPESHPLVPVHRDEPPYEPRTHFLGRGRTRTPSGGTAGASGPSHVASNESSR